MPRQIIQVNIGGCGVNLGKSVLQQFCVEHGISPTGEKERKTAYDDQISSLFEELPNGKYISRSLYSDLNPYSIASLRKRYKYSQVLHTDYLLSGTEDASYNFAKGHYTTGKEHIDTWNEAMRTMFESCDNVQGFMITHSMSGGCGGGFGALALERIAVDYRKKCKIGFEIFPNENRASSSLETLNALLSLHWLLDHTEVSVIFDNKAMDKLCRNKINISRGQYKHYNNIIAKTISNYTANSRFGLNEGFGSIYAGLVPFPRLHFMTPSMSPIIGIKNIEMKQDNDDNNIDYDNIQNISSECVEWKNFMIDYPGYNPLRDKYLAIDFYFRGNDIYKYVNHMNEAMVYLNDSKQINWVDFVSNKPTVKYTANSASVLRDDIIKTNEKQVTMIGNNTRIGRFFTNRIANKYDKLYENRCFVHHYVGEGMEEGEFAEAREDLGFLQKDYNDVLSIQNDDDYDDYDYDESF